MKLPEEFRKGYMFGFRGENAYLYYNYRIIETIPLVEGVTIDTINATVNEWIPAGKWRWRPSIRLGRTTYHNIELL